MIHFHRHLAAVARPFQERKVRHVIRGMRAQLELNRGNNLKAWMFEFLADVALEIAGFNVS